MDYSMEDSQNSAPGTAPAAAKAGVAKKGPDSQSVTKRSVVQWKPGRRKLGRRGLTWCNFD